jgi:hypothetical protein
MVALHPVLDPDSAMIAFHERPDEYYPEIEVGQREFEPYPYR